MRCRTLFSYFWKCLLLLERNSADGCKRVTQFLVVGIIFKFPPERPHTFTQFKCTAEHRQPAAALKLRIILTLSGLVSTIHPRLKCNWWLAEAGASGAPGCQSVSPHPGDPGPWIPSASRAGTSYESLISDNCNTMAARGMGHSYNLAENPLIMLCLLKMSSKGSVCDAANLRATATV